MNCFGFQMKREPAGLGPEVERVAKRAQITDSRERAAAIGKRLGYGGGIDERMAKRAKAEGRFRGRDFRDVLMKGFQSAEPGPMPSIDPKDVEFLNSPIVSPDLRQQMLDAVRKRPAEENAALYYQWAQSITPLRAAIDELVERIGAKATALSRILYGDSSAKRAAAYNAGDLRKFYDYGDGTAFNKSGAGDDDDEAMESYGRAVIESELTPAERNVCRMWKEMRDRFGAQKAAAMRNADTNFASLMKGIFERLPRPMAQAVLDYVS